MYHGPREEALPFFSTLGLTCPPRKAVADFLQEVTSKKDQAVSSCGQCVNLRGGGSAFFLQEATSKKDQAVSGATRD